MRSGPVSGTQQRALRPAAVRDASGRLWVTWHSFDGESSEVYVCNLAGSSWSAPEAVSASSGLDVCPAIACDDNGQPCVVWQSKATGNWNIYVSHYDGSSWTQPALVDSNPGFNLNPAITGSAGDAPWVVWQNYEAGGNWEIYAQNLPLTGVSEGPAQVKDGPQLAGAPNPSNGRLTIRYSTGAAGFGRLAVYDRLGRLSGDLGVVRGRGTVRCPALPAGIYFARLKTGTSQLETKLVLL